MFRTANFWRTQLVVEVKSKSYVVLAAPARRNADAEDAKEERQSLRCTPIQSMRCLRGPAEVVSAVYPQTWCRGGVLGVRDRWQPAACFIFEIGASMEMPC